MAQVEVLHVFKDAYPPTYGGVEQHIWELARALRGEVESTVLTSSRSLRGCKDVADGVRFVRVPEYGRLFSTPVTPSWAPLIRAAPGIVHLHLPLPLAEAAALAASPSGLVVASWYADVARDPAVARFYTRLQQRFLARADRIVVSSHVLAQRSPALAPHADRVAVIPFGFDPSRWPADPERVAAIRRSCGRPVVVFLGRLVHYKGVDVLLDAMREVDAALLVVGDGPFRRSLEARAAGRSSVRFVGTVSNEERSAYYCAADVFVLPAVSRAETFGIAMLEAMSFGTPAVSTQVGTGTSWVNVHGETGLVVRPRNPAELADAISTLLADDALRKELGEGAARRAASQFSKRAMVEGFSDLYRALASETDSPRRAQKHRLRVRSWTLKQAWTR